MSLIYSYVNHSGHVIEGVGLHPLISGITGSNPDADMDIHFLCLLCVV